MQRRSHRASIAEPQGSDNIHELASYLQQCCPSTLAYWPRTTFWSQRPDRAKSTATRGRFARMREVMRTRPTSRDNGWPYGRTPGSGAANNAESQGAETVPGLATRRHKISWPDGQERPFGLGQKRKGRHVQLRSKRNEQCGISGVYTNSSVPRFRTTVLLDGPEQPCSPRQCQ